MATIPPPLTPSAPTPEAEAIRRIEGWDLLRYAYIHLALRVVIGVGAFLMLMVLSFRDGPQVAEGLPILATWFIGVLVFGAVTTAQNVRRLAGWSLAWDLLGTTVGIGSSFVPEFAALYYFPYVIIAAIAATYYGVRGIAITGLAGTAIWAAMVTIAPGTDLAEEGTALAVGVGIMVMVGGVLALAERNRVRGYQAEARAQTADQAVQERDLVASLFAASRSLASAPDEAALAREAVRAARGVVPAELVALMAYDPVRQVLAPLAWEGRTPAGGDLPPWPLGQGVLGHAVRTRQPYLAADTRSDPYFRDGVGDFGAELALPVASGDTLLGVLDVNRDAHGSFTAGEQRALELYVDLLASAWRERRAAQVRAREQQRQDRLGRLAMDLLAATSEETLVEVTTAALRDLLPVTYVAVWDLEGEEAVARARWRIEEVGIMAPRLPLARAANLRRALASGRAAVMKDDSLPAGRAALAPLRGRTENLGAITAVLGEGNGWDTDAVVLLESVASTLALRTENLRLQERARAQAERIIRLNDFTRTLAASLDLEAVAAQVGIELGRLVPFDVLALHVARTGGRFQTLVSQAGATVGPGQATILPADDPLWTDLAASADPASDPLADGPDPGPRLEELEVRSHLTIPLVVNRETVGAVSLLSAQPGLYGVEVLTDLKPLAEQLAIAVANSRLYRQVREQAGTLERMNRLTQIARSSLDLDDILPAFVRELESAVPSLENVGFVIAQEGGYRVVTSAQSALAYTRGRFLQHPQPATERAIEAGAPVRMLREDLGEDAPPGAMEWLDANGIQVTVHYPLISAGRPLGAAILAARQTGDLSDEVVAELAPALDQFAVAVDHALTYEESQRSLVRRGALAEAAAALNADLDLRVSFIPFMDAISRVLTVQGASALMVEERRVRRFAGWGLAGPVAPSSGQVLGPNNPLLQNQVAFVELATSPLPTDQYYYGLGLRYRVAIPLVTEDGLVGVWAMFRTGRPFTEGEVALVQQAVSQLATVLTNSRLFLETRAARDRIQAYARIAALVNASASLEEAFDELVTEARKILPFDGFRLLDLDQQGTVISYRRVLHTRDAIPSRAAAGDALTSPVAIQAIRTGRPVIRPTVTLSDNPETVPSGVASTMLLPITAKGSTVGLLILSSGQEDAFDDNSVQLMEPIVGFLAAELERARAFSDMERSALTDPLTGVANRRLFEELLDGEYHRSRRQELPLSVMVLDLDYFKQVNDSYGHLVGDQLLRQVTAALQDGLRRSDRLARLGGDEFVVLLPETDGAGAALVAAKLIERVESGNWDLGARVTDARVGLSVGIASLVPGQPGPGSPSAFLESADQALYEAKRTGRGRAVLADTTTHP